MKWIMAYENVVFYNFWGLKLFFFVVGSLILLKFLIVKLGIVLFGKKKVIYCFWGFKFNIR